MQNQLCTMKSQRVLHDSWYSKSCTHLRSSYLRSIELPVSHHSAKGDLSALAQEAGALL